MENLRSLWSTLGPRRAFIAGLVTIAIAVAVIGLSRMATSRDVALLYSGLESDAAGEVIAALQQRNAIFEVRGSAIYVASSDRDILRMTLASEGLPASTSRGYELLDELSGFGTTSQMFDAAYWRAKEGELARTILANPNVRSARVHISSPTNRPFQRDQMATAAVTVTTQSGSLSAAQARAMRFLVAAAVSGLSPDDVAVIDSEGGLIPGIDDALTGTGSDSRQEDLRNRVERMLEARVGYGNAVVELTIDTVTETESIVERRIDPDSRIAISTDVEERINTSNDSRGGDVTVASNLPDGDAAGDPGSSLSENNETRAVTNFDLSQTQREVQRGPGGVKRLTVAVLVNDLPAADGALPLPRSPEELDALRDLVSAAVGFDAERGDVITIRSMSFEAVPSLGTEASLPVASPLNLMSLLQLATFALVALILGLFVLRPLLLSGPKRQAEPLTLAAAEEEEEPFMPEMNFGMGFPTPTLNGVFDDDDDESQSDVVGRLRQLIEDRQDETLQILQNWIDEPDPVGQR